MVNDAAQRIKDANTLAEVIAIYKEAGSEKARGEELVIDGIELVSAMNAKIGSFLNNGDLNSFSLDVLTQMQELGDVWAEQAKNILDRKLADTKQQKENAEKELDVYLQGMYVEKHPNDVEGQATWESPKYKAWAAQYADSETRNLREKIAQADREITQIENYQKSLTPQPQQKSAPQQEQNVEKPRITVDNVFECAQKEDLSKWNATEMHTLLTTLNSGRQTFNAVKYDPEARNALRAKLEKTVVKFSQDFYDNKLVILNMNDAYIWQDVVKSCAEHPESEYGKENVEAVEKAKEKVADQITGFEEEFGLDKKLSQEQIAINLKELEKLPDTSELFAHQTPNYPVQPATENYNEIQEIVATYRQSGDIPKLSVLVGALQNKYLSQEYDGIKETLEQWAVERIKLTTKLEKPEDIGNFDKLLSLIPQDSNSALIKSKRQLVTTAKEAHEQALPLERPELQEAYNLLNRLEFQGELSTFGRKKLTQEEQKELRNLILQQVEAETRMFLVNTEPTGVSKDRYIQEFNDRLNKHIFHLVAADAINKGNITPQEIQTQLTKVASRKGPITVNHYSFIGWKIAQNNRFGAAVSRLEMDQKTASVGQYFKGKLANLQQNITQHCSQNPLVAGFAGRAMGVAQACGWAVLYGVAASNPVALGLVSAASLANTCWSFYKKYRTAKAVAESKGQPLSFWGYVKNNKVDTAMSVCGAVMAITGGAAALNAISQPLAGTMMSMASTSMTALMGLKSFEVAKDTFNKTQGSFWKKSAYALGAAGVVFGTYILTRKAAQGVSGAVQGMDFSGDSTPQDTQLSSVSQDNINTPTYGNDDLGLGYKSPFSQFLGQEGADASDVRPPLAPEPPAPEIDPNNLNQEQQHDIDMLFKRAPADANKILGDGDWHSSAELQKMWENGEISQEKMQDLLDHAAKTFDDKGHFVDVDGKIDQARENDAAEWQRQHDAATKSAPEPTPEPEPKFTPEKQEGVSNNIDLSGLDRKISPLSPDDLNLSKGETSNTIPSAEPQNEEGINVTKVKTNENGDVKVVYRDADGHRHVHHTDSDTLDTEGASKVKFNGENSIRSAAEDVVAASIAEKHGLEGAEKITLTHTDGTEIEILKGSNGWARVDESGVDTLVKNEDGSYTFSTGVGEQAKPMTYEDAKEFVKDLGINSEGLSVFDTMKSLYQNYPEEYARNVSADLGVADNVKVTYNQEDGSTRVVSDRGVTITDKDGLTSCAVIDERGNIQLKFGNEALPSKDFNMNDENYRSFVKDLSELASQHPDSEIAQAFAAREAEIQLQQNLASRGISGAEPIEGSVGDDSNQTTFYNSKNGCALIGEDGKISTLVEKDGNYSFSNGDGGKMTFLEAKDFGQKVSNFHTGADGDSGFATEFDETDLNKALYQNYPAEYTDNVADRLGLGGKITQETAQTGVTTFVGENGVGIMAENGEAVAAFLDQEGKLQLVSSSLGQEPKEITNPHLIDNLKQIATTNGNSDIVDAITAKQAEASQTVASNGQTVADNATPADPKAEASNPETKKDNDVSNGQEGNPQQLSLKEAYEKDIVAHGIKGAKPTYLNSATSISNNGSQTTFASFDRGDNGYISTSYNGANSLVFDDEGKAKFQTGSGDDIRPMTYEEAKAFNKVIDAAGNPTTEEILRNVKALYDYNPEEYVKDAAQQAGITGDGKFKTADGLSMFVTDNGVCVTDDRGMSYIATVKEGGNIETSIMFGDEKMNQNVDGTMYEALEKIAKADPNSDIAKAFSLAAGKDAATSAGLSAETLRGPSLETLKTDPYYQSNNGIMLSSDNNDKVALVLDDDKHLVGKKFVGGKWEDTKLTSEEYNNLRDKALESEEKSALTRLLKRNEYSDYEHRTDADRLKSLRTTNASSSQGHGDSRSNNLQMPKDQIKNHGR